jgi:hypothetical protein
MFSRHPLKRLRPTYVTYFLRFRFDFIYRMSTKNPLKETSEGFFVFAFKSVNEGIKA